MQHNGMLMHWTKAMNCPPACANLATVVHEPSPNLCNGSVEEVVGFVGSRRRWTCETERLDRVGRFTGGVLGIKPNGRIPPFAIKARQRLGSLALTLSEEGFWAMSWEDQAYPRPWRELRDAPVVVFGSGNQRAMNDRPFAAVVGTRDCSQRAAELGFEVGRFLAGQDWGVVSGLARGVDAMAHRGACYAEGLTVACLGSPLRPIYPREHRELASEIVRRVAAP